MHRSSAICILAALPAFAHSQLIGPSTGAKPYLLPAQDGVVTVSLFTVGDYVSLKGDGQPYYMVGLPDGLGALAAEGGTFDLLVNHELNANVGVTREHGYQGAFVSRWNINPSTFEVTNGWDLIHNVNFTGPPGAFSRFCSADLAAATAYYNRNDKTGTMERLFRNGEEVGAEGRAFAHIVTGPNTGTSYELASLGNLSWENLLACPAMQQKTIVIGQDDSTPGQVYVYVGSKHAKGNEIERAGLTGGILYGVKVPGVAQESRTDGIFGATTFELQNLGDVSGKTGAELEADSDAAAVTEFLRPEDGAWDPQNPNDYYFVTTDRFSNGYSRLWRLRFKDISRPEVGGEIEMLLDGTEGQKMMDNIVVDSRGNIIMQEDPGLQWHLARIWKYTIASDTVEAVVVHNPWFFDPLIALRSITGFKTYDEESSGVVEAPWLGANWYLVDVQAHYALGGEFVGGGQLLAVYIP